MIQSSDIEEPIILSGDKKFDMWIVLTRTGNRASRLRSRELAKYGISTIMAAVLHIVHDTGNRITLAELSRQLAREAHTISGLVSRMERQGLVRKVRDLDKKNMVRVELTEKGHEAYKQTVADRESVHRIASVLSDEEIDHFVSYLYRILGAAYKELG